MNVLAEIELSLQINGDVLAFNALTFLYVSTIVEFILSHHV